MTSRLSRYAAALLLVGVSFVGLAVCSAEPATGTAAVDLKAVRYADLGRAIRALRGRVVVVDFWSTGCVPCMREFPHFVELNGRLGPAGAACVSVALDPPEKHARALAFLTDRR